MTPGDLDSYLTISYGLFCFLLSGLGALAAYKLQRRGQNTHRQNSSETSEAEMYKSRISDDESMRIVN